MANSITDKAIQQLFCDGVKIVKLWENASSNSAFQNQTVSLNIAKYDFVMVLFRLDRNGRVVEPSIVPIGRPAVNNSKGYDRYFIVRETGIEFDDSSSPSAIIPAKIFGIKLLGGGYSLIRKIKQLFANIRRCFIWQY